MIAVHNSSGQPQVVTSEGRLVGAGEFAAVDPDDRTAALLEQGVLAKISGKPTEDMDPAAAEALRATQPVKKES